MDPRLPGSCLSRCLATAFTSWRGGAGDRVGLGDKEMVLGGQGETKFQFRKAVSTVSIIALHGTRTSTLYQYVDKLLVNCPGLRTTSRVRTSFILYSSRTPLGHTTQGAPVGPAPRTRQPSLCALSLSRPPSPLGSSPRRLRTFPQSPHAQINTSCPHPSGKSR